MFPFHFVNQTVSKDVRHSEGKDATMDKVLKTEKAKNYHLSLAYHNLTEVPAKILKKYSSTLTELDLSHNQVQYPLLVGIHIRCYCGTYYT